MITPKMKDDILSHLVEAEVGVTHHDVDAGPILINTGINIVDFNGILQSFKSEGLIEYDGLSRGSNFTILVHVKAHDKLYNGGYQMEGLILENEIIKLQDEIEGLNNKYGIENVANVTSIVANLTALFSALYRK